MEIAPKANLAGQCWFIQPDKIFSNVLCKLIFTNAHADFKALIQIWQNAFKIIEYENLGPVCKNFNILIPILLQMYEIL